MREDFNPTDDPNPWQPQQPAAQTGAGDPWTPQELAESQNWANQWYSSHNIPSSYGTPDDIANSYVEKRRAGMSHADAMAYLQTVPGLLGWDKTTATDNPNPSPAPPPGGTGGGTGSGSLIAPFTQPAPTYNPSPLPTFASEQANGPISIGGAPAFPTIPAFQQPTMDEAMNDPGYKFTLDQGNNNLQNWAAARGTLNDSSTGKALIDYGQGAATTQYGNVWNRDYNAYNANVQTQYVQPWQAAFQNWATGTVQPTVMQYGVDAANAGHVNDTTFQNNWNSWLQSWNQFRDQRDSTFSKQLAVA